MEKKVNLPLAWKWFVSLMPEQRDAHYSTLCRFQPEVTAAEVAD